MIDRIQWLGHGTFRIQGPPLIYINPWRVARPAFHADTILISNDQYDHCSPADIEKLRGPHTQIISNARVARLLDVETLVLRPWQSVTIGAARVTAVPAYTFTDDHPVSEEGLGFIISIDYYDIYYAGSTDIVPELGRIRADIALLPVAAGRGTLNIERAVELVETMRPEWVVPTHWGVQGGTLVEVQALERALYGRAKFVQLDKMR